MHALYGRARCFQNERELYAMKRPVQAVSLFFAALVATALAAACAVEETKYVGPEALVGKQPPPPKTTASGPVGDAGSAPLCNGAGPIDGGPCAKSWKNDIYTPLVNGVWKCSDPICHQDKPGGPAYQPAISDQDATRAWNALASYMITQKRYIDPCSTDPAVSAITCNLQNPACGLAQMPYTGLSVQGAAPTPDQLATLATWLKCGAPNN